MSLHATSRWLPRWTLVLIGVVFVVCIALALAFQVYKSPGEATLTVAERVEIGQTLAEVRGILQSTNAEYSEFSAAEVGAPLIFVRRVAGPTALETIQYTVTGGEGWLTPRYLMLRFDADDKLDEIEWRPR